MNLDHLVRVQDALDAMDDTSCLTREDFVAVNKPAVQHLYASAWDDAKELIRTHGLSNAVRYVAERIEKFGCSFRP